MVKNIELLEHLIDLWYVANNEEEKNNIQKYQDSLNLTTEELLYVLESL